jgi:Tfp pilus assembly protein PilX
MLLAPRTMRAGVLRLYSNCVRLRADLARENGMALIVALGTLLVVGVTGTTLLYYTSANTRSSSYSRASGASFQLAEAGLHEALAVLSNQPTNDPANPALLATRTSTYSTGSVTWGGTYDTANAKWTITSTGRVANPANVPPSEATRTITAKVPIRPVATQQMAVESWNYLFSYGTGDPDGCDMDTLSSVSIETRVMVSGNLCVKDSSTIEGSNSQVLVGGQLKTFGSASIGKGGSNPAGLVDVAGGCKYESGTLHSPCKGPSSPSAYSDKVWATTIDTTPALETAPNPDWAYWYANASPGPTENCTGANRSGPVPVFDNDLVQDRDAPRADLTRTSSYTCRTYLGPHPLGELSWNNTTKLLTIRGTIFIDGDAYVTQKAGYTGQATLYMAGSFWMSSSWTMCAVRTGGAESDCNWTVGAWDPNTSLLTIVTKGGGGNAGAVVADTSVLIDSSTQWQGAIYGGAYKARLLSSIRFQGPVIADEVYVDSSLQTEPFSVIVTSPTAMPGNSSIYAKPDKLELFSG